MSSASESSWLLRDHRAPPTSYVEKVPAALQRQPSSAQVKQIRNQVKLTKQPSTACSSVVAICVSAITGASKEYMSISVGVRTRPLAIKTSRSWSGFSDRSQSNGIAAINSTKTSFELTKFSFPPDLQDPLLSARRYRIVKKLGKGSYGKVFLAWDERRQYVKLLVK